MTLAGEECTADSASDPEDEADDDGFRTKCELKFIYAASLGAGEMDRREEDEEDEEDKEDEIDWRGSRAGREERGRRVIDSRSSLGISVDAGGTDGGGAKLDVLSRGRLSRSEQRDCFSSNESSSGTCRLNKPLM